MLRNVCFISDMSLDFIQLFSQQYPHYSHFTLGQSHKCYPFQVGIFFGINGAVSIVQRFKERSPSAAVSYSLKRYSLLIKSGHIDKKMLQPFVWRCSSVDI